MLVNPRKLKVGKIFTQDSIDLLVSSIVRSQELLEGRREFSRSLAEELLRTFIDYKGLPLADDYARKLHDLYKKETFLVYR